MKELLVQHKDPSTERYDRLTAEALKLVSMHEPVQWSRVEHKLAALAVDAGPHPDFVAHSTLWHTLKAGAVIMDDNGFLRLAPKSDETM